MKKFWIAVAIIVPLGFIIGLMVWGNNIWKKIKFGIPYIKKIDLKGRTPSDLINAFKSLAGIGQYDLDIITLGFDIKNDSNTSIPISDIEIQLFYEGVEVGATSPNLKQKRTITKGGTAHIEDTPHIILNEQSGRLLTHIFTKQKPEIEFKVKLKMYGIPIPLPIINFPKLEGKQKIEY